jgi:hypothetical protein
MQVIKSYWYWIVIIILSALLIYEKVYDYNTEKYYKNCLRHYFKTKQPKFSKEEIIDGCILEKHINTKKFRDMKGLSWL